ncbi:MAG: aminotransferase class IV [Chloroflexi bacterium]|nr:aminotransferase class IV [Chloroflexota bacterium]
MEDLVCYYNGNYVNESEVRISPLDNGLWKGAIYDIARSFNHVPHFWDLHISRLYRSLSYVSIDPGMPSEEMLRTSYEVFNRNKKYLIPADDFSMIWWISAGAPTYQYFEATNPTILIRCVHAIPRYEGWVKMYREGQHLVVPNTRQIPLQSLDAKVKHTNRLCYRLADKEVAMIDRSARAVVLNLDGSVAEGTGFNVFIAKDGKLFTPRLGNLLPGITRGTVMRLAKELGIDCIEKDLYVYDLRNADEIFTTANGFIGPVSKFNGKLLPKPFPGVITEKLHVAFSKVVGVDMRQRVFDYVNSKAAAK